MSPVAVELRRGDTAETKRTALAAAASQFPSGWDLALDLRLSNPGSGVSHACSVRATAPGDEGALVAFGLGALSDESCRTFAPYDWASPSLTGAFCASIAASVARLDLHLVATAAEAEADAAPAGLVNLSLSANRACEEKTRG